jgi:Protein of unknown function (DUF723)
MSDKNNQFIKKAIAIHGSLYDYSSIDYKTAKTKVAIGCSVHGTFMQTPNNHLLGNKCPMCRGRFELGSPLKKKYALEKAISIHGEKYDYSEVNFSNDLKEPVSIICKVHGEFKQLWGNHVGIHNQNGCPTCARDSTKEKQKLGLKSFVKKARTAHGKKYDYSKCDYKSAHEKVTIICKKHGEFRCTPANHWSNKVGCPNCIRKNPSKGETIIANWLDKNKIPYTYQKSYSDLWWKSKKGRLKYDFFIPSFKLLIEYDGEHHYKDFSWSKSINGKKRLNEQKIKDRLKNEYAHKNNINLLRIKYDQNIDEELSKIFISQNRF